MLANVVLACALYLFSERGPGSAYDTRGAAGLGNITNIAKELLGDSLTGRYFGFYGYVRFSLVG